MRFDGISKGFFILILFIVTIAFLDVLEPYYSSVLWAIILAVIFHPMKNRIKQHIGEKNGLASFLTVMVICLIVFTPLGIIFSSLAIELNVVYNKLQSHDTQLPAMLADVMQHLPVWVRHFLTEHNLDSTTEIQQKLSGVALKGGQYLAGSVFVIGKSTFGFTVGLGIMLYLLFFLLKDGAYLVNLTMQSLPLSKDVKHHLFVKFAAVSRATVKGTVVVAIVQGILGGLAFYFTGIEGSLLWGALMAFLSIIPAVALPSSGYRLRSISSVQACCGKGSSWWVSSWWLSVWLTTSFARFWSEKTPKCPII